MCVVDVWVFVVCMLIILVYIFCGIIRNFYEVLVVFYKGNGIVGKNSC